MHLVTGASDNHYKSLINMILSFMKYHKNDPNYVIVVYNLGIEESLWERLINLFGRYSNFVVEVFDYGLYPDYVNININAGEYAWKPIVIYDVFNKYKDVTLWMDAGNIIINKLDKINELIKKDNIYSGYSAGNIKQWTHEKTIEYMGGFYNGYDLTISSCRNGACIGFNYNTDYVKTFVEEYRNYALIKECIAPEGSSRENHRQDQSVFSIMFYKYYIQYQFDFSMKCDDYFTDYKIHNDVD
jgi:hypothetical protein